tara:strand:+ start:28 stop:897 length:870 start_codon:yes stop_codon:yes gene_type:complete
MKANSTTKIMMGALFLVFALSFTSGLVVDADYMTLYPGEQERVNVEIENNENFDIEEISMTLNLEDVPFTSIGSSEKDLDDVDEDDTDNVFFTLKSFTDVTPGDYDVPYSVTYVNAENDSESFEKTGSFGIRVGAKTDLDFSVEIRGNAIIGEEGRISLEVINRGLGEVKSMSVKVFPSGFELLSKDKVFVGTIDADDTDLASFEVIYKNTNPSLSARIEYKDFDNNEQVETVNLPFKVYTKEKALELGLIQKSNTSRNIITVFVILVLWFAWRGFKKRRRNNKLGGRN